MRLFFRSRIPRSILLFRYVSYAGSLKSGLLRGHQNPPTIPTLAIVWLVSWLRGSKVIIDWHNLGYTILAMRLGEKSRFVALAKK
jgi:hypothetical protein